MTALRICSAELWSSAPPGERMTRPYVVEPSSVPEGDAHVFGEPLLG